MKRYEPLKIEKKWQDIWQKENTFLAKDLSNKNKLYCAEMFPYPSGAGLHVGHVRNFTIVDVLARFYRQQGFNVLRTIGWDTFGLPAENYALKTGVSPKSSTKTNINNFKNQYKRLGMAVDWTREINTSDPEYYRWTQWIFTKLFEKGLAYRSKSYQWWCPVDKTVLANEQVEAGKCWRCGNEVEKKNMSQWFFKITAYADELLDELDSLDWPEKIKTMQRNWIGRSVGAEVEFKIEHSKEIVKVFTTRVDTLFGATFIVLAPENNLVDKLTNPDQSEAVKAYCKAAIKKSEIERQENKEKTGVFTGSYAINPVNGDKMPIWVADYVLAGYGQGAVMAVPAHDKRDNEFAKKFNLVIKKVIDPTEDIDDDNVIDLYAGEGRLINSGDFNGIKTSDAREQLSEFLQVKGIGRAKTTYRMRDWLISRQRYWGAPIPIIHCDKCGDQAVPAKDLPVLLPDISDYAPAGDGRSPLAKIKDFYKTTCPKCHGEAKRETDTMDGYACSSWYLFRYIDAHNHKEAWDKAKVDYFAPIDYYVGGDHAVAHLLYIRFWTKFFADLDLLDFREPIKRLLYNGYINAPDGRKMSKSKGNVIDPLEVIDSGYGADTLRTYEMFIGPYNLDAAWNTSSIGGVYRFLTRSWNLVQEFIEAKKVNKLDDTKSDELIRLKNVAIKKVTKDIVNYQFNTAVAGLMEYLNGLNKIKDYGFDQDNWREVLIVLAQLLEPFAPHVASEMYTELVGDKARLEQAGWPKWDEKYLQSETMKIAIQVNGKLRGDIEVAKDAKQVEIEKLAYEYDNVKRFISNKTIKRTIYIPGRIINIVVS